MSTTANEPRRVHAAVNDVDAAILVGLLRDAGLNATAVGGYTAGFSVEAPGEVSILVPADEADAAREILQSLPKCRPQQRIPADRRSPGNAEREPAQASPDVPRPLLRVNLRQILFLQSVAAVALFVGISNDAAVPLIVAAGGVLAFFAVCVAATIRLAQQPKNAYAAWKSLGTLLVSAFAANMAICATVLMIRYLAGLL